MSSRTALQISPLTKRSMTLLLAKAKQLGLPPEDYARQLLEDGLSFQREAERSTFAQIMAPVRKSSRPASDSEILKLVSKARASYHASTRRPK